MPTTFTTLRSQLALTTLIGFLLVVGTALTHFRAVEIARSAVDTAARSYQRVALYTRLSYAAAEFEGATLHALAGEPGTQEARDATRGRFQALLDQARRSRFPTSTGDRRRTQLVRQGEAVITALNRFESEAPRLERLERAEGFRALGAEVTRLKSPSDQFRRDLGAEVRAADAEIAAASRRVETLGRSSETLVILILGAALLATAVAMMLLLARLKRGLDALEGGARALSQGALGHRIALGGKDELARLAASFDAMAEDLSFNRSALQTANAGLEAAVASRTRELSTANAALAAEDQNRRRFMADVGHELRTPLTIIRGEAQLALRAADRGTVEPAPIFDRILDQTHALERLVNDLFLIARAESNGLKLQRRRTDLGEIARKAAADFEGLAAEGHAVIRASVQGLVDADVDPDRVRQMLAALIDNALRHTQPGVSIDVVAGEEDGRPTLCVCDDGPGVPPEQAEALFSRFRRGDSAAQGSGLGLAVVRALAEAHGGSAELQPVPSGGLCVKLTFAPVPALAAVRDTVRDTVAA